MDVSEFRVIDDVEAGVTMFQFTPENIEQFVTSEHVVPDESDSDAVEPVEPGMLANQRRGGSPERPQDVILLSRGGSVCLHAPCQVASTGPDLWDDSRPLVSTRKVVYLVPTRRSTAFTSATRSNPWGPSM